tara:strand:+ start:839 stop:1147 length:309 start_codon:yes stop_codon:yes gene_type:complete
MAKKEKEITVKGRAEKIEEKHLVKLQNIVNSINALQFNVGKMEVQKYNAMRELVKAQSEIGEMQNLLLKEYGSYDVNVTDGTINWPKDPSENGIDKPEENEK